VDRPVVAQADGSIIRLVYSKEYVTGFCREKSREREENREREESREREGRRVGRGRGGE